MRIALVAGEDPGWGGIGTYTAILGRALADLGHDVQLILRGWEEDCTETLDGLTVHRVTVPEPSWRRGTVGTMERLYTTRESLLFAHRAAQVASRLGAQIVEGPEFGAPVLRVAPRRSRPVVVRLHSPSFLTARLAAEPARLDLRAQELLEAASAHCAALITSPSRALADVVRRRWKLRRSSIRVVPNPVDSALFTPEPQRQQIPGRILIVGRIERAKGHDVLLEALPRIRAAAPDAHIVAVGGDGGLQEALQTRARALGIDSAVSFAGAYERSELPDLYRSASVCVVPSRFEAFGYTALEAMACGRAVVASRAGGLVEVVEDGVGGLLVDPEAPAPLADAVISLLTDAGRRAEVGRQARSRVLACYGARKVAQEMIEHYRRAVS